MILRPPREGNRLVDQGDTPLEIRNNSIMIMSNRNVLVLTSYRLEPTWPERSPDPETSEGGDDSTDTPLGDTAEMWTVRR